MSDLRSQLAARFPSATVPEPVEPVAAAPAPGRPDLLDDDAHLDTP